MTTGKGPRSRPALALALLTGGLLVTGCGESAGHRTSPSAPSPPVTSDVDLCARVVAHWSREVLDGDTYGDYQSMGLSNGQYDILRRVVDAARTARERDGRPAAERLVDREARRGCAARYRDGGPGGGPRQ